MTINFTGKFLSDTTIKQRIGWRNYMDTTASIVELNPDNERDLDALFETSDNWCCRGGKYSQYIADSAVDKIKFHDIKKEHIFALTTQTADFDKLKSDKILGLMTFSETYNIENEINWLEVDPSSSKKLAKRREYKGVGSELINYLKTAFNSKDIFVMSADDAIKFYKKLGFVSKNKFIDKNKLFLKF